LTSLIEEGLRIVVAGKRLDATQTEKPSSRMPISTQGGGLVAGIDPIKFLADDEELADREMLLRAAAAGRP
jgi:hypothetical protein